TGCAVGTGRAVDRCGIGTRARMQAALHGIAAICGARVVVVAVERRARDADALLAGLRAVANRVVRAGRAVWRLAVGGAVAGAVAGLGHVAYASLRAADEARGLELTGGRATIARAAVRSSMITLLPRLDHAIAAHIQGTVRIRKWHQLHPDVVD